ncbi:MAG TPA: TatD family hydrolase [Candidatus Saccharibacteria bacterium]|nr:TatD family hydrolase [Candidatus Saccharibacteria bacterium]HRK93958.1 TatD family hydrolase [Candidatus Saccharibacteria bacterium]
MLVDTHCHIHEAAYPLNSEEALKRARAADVSTLICVGTDNTTSADAVRFAEAHDDVWATVGAHPHDAKDGYDRVIALAEQGSRKLVAIGEIGLDYFYTHSPKNVQQAAFEAQLQLSVDYNLPVIFHVRDAFDDLWPIISNFKGLRGVLHSFTDNMSNLERGLSEGLYIGLNGISTFTKDENQRKVFDAIPLEHMLLETDAPFLTPSPHRGKVNEPAFVRHVAEYHASRRGVELEHLARVTTANASSLFSI